MEPTVCTISTKLSPRGFPTKANPYRMDFVENSVSFHLVSSWGTAPIEAWNSGCLVAGWDGVGGIEYMKPVSINNDTQEVQGNTWLAPNGDIIKLALAIGNIIETWVLN